MTEDKLKKAIEREIANIGHWRQYCFGGPGSQVWQLDIAKDVEWGDIAWSMAERLRKATGRPKPCEFCHGAGECDVDLGAGFVGIECQACDGTGDGEPWEKDG